jgi:hypothetical protein
VGNTYMRMSTHCSRSVHPHTRGEHIHAYEHPLLAVGPPPHAWGTPLADLDEDVPQRSTPTRVGNTPASCVFDQPDTQPVGGPLRAPPLLASGAFPLGLKRTSAMPSKSTTSRPERCPLLRHTYPCGTRLLQNWSTPPSRHFSSALSHRRSLILELGFPRKTPVLGSISQRDSSPLKLAGTLSKIISSI